MDHWVGERICMIRTLRGMTQSTLGAVVGRGQGWMSKVERGETDPGFHEVEAMLRALGTTLLEVVQHPGALKGITIKLVVEPKDQQTDPTAQQGTR